MLEVNVNGFQMANIFIYSFLMVKTDQIIQNQTVSHKELQRVQKV
jgi:hypothetical protein